MNFSFHPCLDVRIYNRSFWEQPQWDFFSKLLISPGGSIFVDQIVVESLTAFEFPFHNLDSSAAPKVSKRLPLFLISAVWPRQGNEKLNTSVLKHWMRRNRQFALHRLGLFAMRIKSKAIPVSQLYLFFFHFRSTAPRPAPEVPRRRWA